MKRFLKYCTVGLSGVLVNEGFLWLFTEIIGLFYLVSSVIGIELSIVSNFVWNELWTFRDRRFGRRFVRGLKFNSVSIGGLAINITVLYFLVTLFNIHYLVSNLFGIGAATLWNYFVNLKFTWGAKT